MSYYKKFLHGQLKETKSQRVLFPGPNKGNEQTAEIEIAKMRFGLKKKKGRPSPN